MGVYQIEVGSYPFHITLPPKLSKVTKLSNNHIKKLPTVHAFMYCYGTGVAAHNSNPDNTSNARNQPRAQLSLAMHNKQPYVKADTWVQEQWMAY